LKSNKIWRVVLLLAFSQLSYAISVGIFDTGFCSQQIKKLSKNVKIVNTIDLTNSVSLDCDKDQRTGRLHGQKVLKTFLEVLNKDIKVVVHPFIIFDDKGKQSLAYWEKAFSKDITKKLDILIFAAGYPVTQDVNIKINTNSPIFVSQGKYGRGISKTQKLWPQQLHAKISNILIIGAHYPKTQYDKGYPEKRALYLKEAKYYFPDRGADINFTGSSYSVAYASARAINLCYQNENGILSCLKGKSKKLDWDYPLEVLTY